MSFLLSVNSIASCDLDVYIGKITSSLEFEYVKILLKMA